MFSDALLKKQILQVIFLMMLQVVFLMVKYDFVYSVKEL